MEWKTLLQSNLGLVANKAIELIIDEIENQGHIIDVKSKGYSETGKESFEYDIVIGEGSAVINIIANDYILDMDVKQSASSINWNPEDIIDFGKKIYPNISERKVLNRLRGMKRYQQSVGLPNKRSFSWSRNGRRVGWTEFALKGKIDEIEQIMG